MKSRTSYIDFITAKTLLPWLCVLCALCGVILHKNYILTAMAPPPHAPIPEATRYVEVVKEFVGRKPHTMLHLTEKGRGAFCNYRNSIKQVLDELPDNKY